MRISVILAGAAALSLAACTPAKEQAIEECNKQKGLLPAQVDGDRFCECITEKIPDDASRDEAEQVLINEAQTCTMEQLENVMKDLQAPSSEAPATGE